jgi:hypothetical protein
VQSQDLNNARWAVGQRMKRATDAVVERAYDAGEILRTHVLRPTWHFVLPADIRWLLELTAPRIRQLCAYYYKEHGLTAAKLTACDTAIARALRGTTLTRDELGQQLALRGNALAHAVMHAELAGVIASGPRRGKQITYALLDARDSAPRTRDAALAELARRYVGGHGPAQVKDLAWWSGLTAKDAKRAIELADESLERIEVDSVEYFHVPIRATPIAEPHVRLLPNYDELLVAFADRSAARDPRVAEMDHSAFFNNIVTSNGCLIGSYRKLTEKRVTVIDCTLLVSATPAERTALAHEVERLGAFLETPIRLDLRIDPDHKARRPQR